MSDTRSRVPSAHQTVYLVLDDFGPIGMAWRGANSDRISMEVVIADLLDNQYCNPIRVVGFNIVEGWSRDVSQDVARALRKYCSLQQREMPAGLGRFLERHEEQQPERQQPRH